MCAAATKRRSTTRRGPSPAGTWAATTPWEGPGTHHRDGSVAVLAAPTRRTTASVPREVGMDPRARTARRRDSLKEATRVREAARCSSMTSMRGSTTPGTLASILKYMSGKASRTSASSGIFSPGASRWRSREISLQSSWAISPVPSKQRSTASSWERTTLPSAVRWASVSMWRTPRERACSKAAIVFSGASAPPPRWARTIGPRRDTTGIIGRPPDRDKWLAPRPSRPRGQRVRPSHYESRNGGAGPLTTHCYPRHLWSARL